MHQKKQIKILSQSGTYNQKKELSQVTKTCDNSSKRPLHCAALAALLSTFRPRYLHE